MTIPPQKFREIVFQILYSLDSGNSEEEGITSLLMKELCVTKKTIQSAFERARRVISKQPEIDSWIRKVIVSLYLNGGLTEHHNIMSVATRIEVNRRVRRIGKPLNDVEASILGINCNRTTGAVNTASTRKSRCRPRKI